MSESSPAAGPRGGDVRSRLQAALRAAMKARDAVAVSALRSTLAAIANAEAIPVPEASVPSLGTPAAANQYIAGSAPGLAATEAGRREVTEEEAVTIAETEAAERQAAAREYQAARQAGAPGATDRADRLLREARAIRSALRQSG